MVVVTDNKSAPDVPPPAYSVSSPTSTSPASPASNPATLPQSNNPYTPHPGPSLSGPSSSIVGPSNTHGYQTFQSTAKQPDPRDVGYPGKDAGGFKPVGQKVVASPQDLDAGRTVYYYRNPVNGATITSFLPPDHPRSLCLQHGHVPLTTHGVLGILAAVIFFPLGVVCCMIDRRSVCARCGEVLNDGCL